MGQSKNYFGLSSQQLIDLQTNLQNTEAKLTASDYTHLTRHDVVGDLLQSGVMSFMAMTHIQSQLSAQSSENCGDELWGQFT